MNAATTLYSDNGRQSEGEIVPFGNKPKLFDVSPSYGTIIL